MGAYMDSQSRREEQKRDWDLVAAGWNKWWPVFEKAAQHVSDRLIELAEVKVGDRVLDIATGIGEPAMTAARRVGPTGRVVASDQSPGMLAIARDRATALRVTNMDFRENDAQSLALSERDFDAVVCRWGFMFMADLDAALGGIHSRMKPGAHLATAVWSTPDKVPMITVGAASVRQLANLPPPVPGALDPFRLADTSILEVALSNCGFKSIVTERRQVIFEFESAEVFTQFRREVSGPFRALLERQTPELRERIVSTVIEAARAYAGADGKIRTSNETILFAATA